MARERSSAPWFKFFVRDWLTSPTVRCMTPAERGCYIQILALMWNERCALKCSEEMLKQLCGFDGIECDWSKVAKALHREPMLEPIGTDWKAIGTDWFLWTHKKIQTQWDSLHKKSLAVAKSNRNRKGQKRNGGVVKRARPSAQSGTNVGPMLVQKQKQIDNTNPLNPPSRGSDVPDGESAIPVSVLPGKPEKSKAKSRSKVIRVIPADLELPPAMAEPDGRAALLEWLVYKADAGHGLKTLASVKALAVRLGEMGTSRAILAIRFSMSQGWKGCYEESSNSNSRVIERKAAQHEGFRGEWHKA